ncbi:MAG: hypothetical protein QXQ48_04160 [Nitrososphaerota archaeon]
MKGIRELVDPLSLGSAMSNSPRLRRGVLVFLSAAVSHIASSVYYIEEKLRISYASPGIKMPSPPITEASEALFLATLYLSMGFLAVTGVYSVIVYLKGSEKRSLLPVFSSVMHGFLAFTVATLLLLPTLLSTPPLNVVITYAEVDEAKLENVRIVGILQSNQSAVDINSQVLRSPRLIYNASRPSHPLLIESATSRFSDQIIDLGDILVESLAWDRIEFSGLSFKTEPALNREPWSALATALSWLWLVSYVGLACKRLYTLSSRTVAISITISIIVLLIFGLL